jgi:hypothetical protein
MTRPICVCVPARNEAAYVGRLIDALVNQDIRQHFTIALCVNNSDDDTAAIARAVADRAGQSVDLRIRELEFDRPLAHAGSARRAAMDFGVELLGNDAGLLISTDADCRPPADWVASNLAHSSTDRIVGGRIELDEEEAVPAMLLAMRKRYDHYWTGVRAVEDEVDPCPWDPAPRHGDHTGASLAMTSSLYLRAGGVPVIESGEDRALVAAAVAAGAKLIHPQAVWTRASARTVGRAAGGMSLDMQRWMSLAGTEAAPMVPAFDHWRRLAEWRRQHRHEYGEQELMRAEQALEPLPCDLRLPELQ